eukprot:scaffold1172_cov124-Isochrysis_galbana.AAC.3
MTPWCALADARAENCNQACSEQHEPAWHLRAPLYTGTREKAGWWLGPCPHLPTSPMRTADEKAPAQWSTSLGTRGVGSFSRPLVPSLPRRHVLGKCAYFCAEGIGSPSPATRQGRGIIVWGRKQQRTTCKAMMTDPPSDDTEAREQDAPDTTGAKHRAPLHGHTGAVPPDKALSDIVKCARFRNEELNPSSVKEEGLSCGGSYKPLVNDVMTDPLTDTILTKGRERSAPGMSHADTHTPLHGPRPYRYRRRAFRQGTLRQEGAGETSVVRSMIEALEQLLRRPVT